MCCISELYKLAAGYLQNDFKLTILKNETRVLDNTSLMQFWDLVGMHMNQIAMKKLPHHGHILVRSSKCLVLSLKKEMYLSMLEEFSSQLMY